MSTKSTIELTDDNEHIYYEHSDPIYKDGEFLGNTIVMELDKKNIGNVDVSPNGIVITFINPKSEIYKAIERINPDWE